MDRSNSAGEITGEGDEISALREELRAIKDTIADGLIVIDEDNKVLSFNPGAERIFGYRAAEVIGRHVKLLMPVTDRANFEANAKDCLHSGAAIITGSVHGAMGCRKDGTTFPVSLSVGEMHDEGKRQLVAVFREITDTDSNWNLIEGVASNLPGPIFRRIQHSDGTFQFTYVSEGLKRFFDLDPDAVKADPDYLIRSIHPDDLQGWCDAIEKAVETMTPHDHQMRVTGEDGQTRWMRAIARPHRADNGVIVWDGLALDITGQKRAETERRESAEQFKNFLEAAPDAVWITAGDFIVYANTAAARMLGVDDLSDLIGKTNAGITDSDAMEEISRQQSRLRRGERLPPFEIRWRRQDGSDVDTDTSVIGVSWNGQPAILTIARDITARKEREAQLRQAQKMEAIGQLTGGVAHDFNNLLAVLLMDLEQLSDRQTGDETEQLLEEAQDIAHSAADLTARLLAFSRQQELRPERADLRNLIAECVSLLRRTIGEHIELDTITAGDLWPVFIDSRQLENALLNLCVNARDAMPSGGRITIEAQNISLDEDTATAIDGLQAGDYIRISVTDTGSGIPEAIREKVFDPFFTTKGIGAGTGLGLSMVYGFAKQSDGRTTIDSEEGRGTVVSLYLPRATLDNAAETSEDPKTTAALSGDETILLVEDFPQLRKRSAQMLSKLGYTVIDTGNGPEALAALADAGHVDLLFTDLVMPNGMSGFDLAARAREILPDIKVLYTSGYAEGAESDFGTVDTSGPRLGKPYSRHELAQAVRRALDRDQGPREDSA